MNARIAIVLLILLAVLGGGALLVQQKAGELKPADAAGLGQPLFKDLQAAQITTIAIREPGATLTLVARDGRWSIAERAGFPADFDKVRDFTLKALALKIGQSEPIGEKDRARLNLDASGTAVEFLGADGKPLARLVAGRKYFKAEPEDAKKARADGRYVALAGDEKRVIVVSDPLSQVSTRTADWISKTGIAAEKVKSLEVRDAAGAAWKIERSGDNADWKLVGARADEKLEITKANAAAYTFSQIALADVAPKDIKPELSGLDNPILVTAATLDGLTYTLRLGRLEGENYYASIAVAGEPKPEGKDAEERLKKMADRVAQEKSLADYIVLIPKAKLEDILRKRADLLAKKEEKKK
jgi:hypothetical protein